MKNKIIIGVLLVLILGVTNQLFSLIQPVADKNFPKEVKQFDFWIGDWNYEALYPVKGKVYKNNGIDNCRKVAKRIIESKMNSNAIIGGFFQNTYTLYDIYNKKWRMTILDPNWGQYELTGVFKDEKAVLYSKKREGDSENYRITFYDIKKDSFKITWATSKDNIKWKDVWFLKYKKIIKSK